MSSFLRTSGGPAGRGTVTRQNPASRSAIPEGSVIAGHRLLLVVLCVAEFMIALDFSIVNVALPDMKTALGFSQGELQWVISAYALAFGGLLLLGGRAADLFGRRRMLTGGLTAFAAASLVAGFAVSPVMVIVLRAAQGAAAAVIAPAALSMLTTTFAEGPARQKALGVWASVLGAGFVAGVVAGGVLTSFISWRAVFFVNVPIAAAAAMLAPVVARRDAARHTPARIDVLGAVLATGAVVALVFALSEANTAGWLSAQTLGVLAGAVLLAAAFITAERRTPNPLIPLVIFRLRALSVANLVNLLVIGAFAGYVLIVTLFLQQVHGYSPLVTGMEFAAAGAAGFMAGMIAPRFLPRLGPARTLAAAATLQAAGLAALVSLPATGTLATVALLAVVVNFADVVAIVMINVCSTTGVPADTQGLAGGVLNASQQVGAALGVAVLSAVATARSQALGHGLPAAAGAAALVGGFRYALAGAAMLSALAAVIAFAGLRPRSSRRMRPRDAGQNLT